jgi:Methyltransferase domain
MTAMWTRLRCGLFRDAPTYAIALRNLLIGGNLASLSLLAKPRLMVFYASENLFSLRLMTNHRSLPQKHIFEVFPQVERSEILLYNHGSYGNWFNAMPSYIADIIGLAMLCRAIQPKTIFEIGTLTGYTATHMAMNSSPDCQVYTLDLPPGSNASLPVTMQDVAHVELHEQRPYFWDGIATEKVKALWGDSATFDYTPFHGAVDLFFIDGAHSYEYVRSDTLNALKCCHPGSVIAWHDFGRAGVNGVSRWLHEFSKKHAVYSIPGGSLAFSAPL